MIRRGGRRSQGVLFPERFEYWISEDNPVQVIDVIVDELDLKALSTLHISQWCSRS